MLHALNPIFARWSILDRGASARQKINGDRESPWKIPLFIFTLSSSIVPFVLGSDIFRRHVFMVDVMKWVILVSDRGQHTVVFVTRADGPSFQLAGAKFTVLSKKN